MIGTEGGVCHLWIIEEVVAGEIEGFEEVGAGVGAGIAGRWTSMMRNRL